MSVRHALLALLSEGPKYGLQLREEFEAGTGEVWPLNVGQVYTTLQLSLIHIWRRAKGPVNAGLESCGPASSKAFVMCTPESETCLQHICNARPMKCNPRPAG